MPPLDSSGFGEFNPNVGEAEPVVDVVCNTTETKIGPYLHKMITTTAAKIRDIRRGHPERPIILVGWGVAAAINCTIAAMEQAINSQGFEGLRGIFTHFSAQTR